jgi:hypothetical protein
MHHRTITRARRRGVALLGLVATLGMAVVATAPPTMAGSGNTLNVTAGEYVYQLKGNPAPGLVTMNFVNSGVEYHMLALSAVKPGTTAAQVKKAVLGNDEAAFNALVDTSIGDQGNLDATPSLLGPKQKTSATVQIPAGTYVMMCFIPAAGDGQPHAAHGMIKTFVVKGKKSTAKPPTTQATVTLKDDGIDFPLTNPGRNLSLKITNAGTTPHGFSIVKLEPGKTVDDAKTYFNALFNGENPAGDPPATFVGGIEQIAPGANGYLQQTLGAGHYAYVSTVGDDPATDDSTRGLVGEFTVK